MPAETDDWRRIDDLARQYYADVQRHKEDGVNTKLEYSRITKEFTDNRTECQKQLAGQIITEVVPFLYSIAKKMLNKGVAIHTPNGTKILSLRPYRDRISADDLVGEGTIAIIRHLQDYNPIKGAASTFIGYKAAANMYRQGREGSSILRIPVYVAAKFSKYVDRKHPKSGIRELVERTEVGPRTAAAIQLSLTNVYQNMNEPIETGNKNRWDRALTFEEVYLPDPSQDTEEKAMAEEQHTKIRQELATLAPREENVLRRHYGIGRKDSQTLEEVGQDLHVTKQRIVQIEAKAMAKLRNPKRKLRLEGLL